MEAVAKKSKEVNVDRHDPMLDGKAFPPSKKLEKAKAYFQEHGVPDFDKIIKESEEKKKQVNAL